MMMAEEANGTASATSDTVDDIPVSPTTKTAIAVGLPQSSALESLSMRADPDAQATVTDYLDFTEYLPADVNRSLTLIGKLDQAYIDASAQVHELTTTWGKLPSLPANQRPAPAELRADISRNLSQAVNSRISSHAEAQRMSEYVNRHVNRAKTILAKLQHMRDNYPTEEQKSPVQTRSPQLTRTPKVSLPLDKDGNRIRRPPRITVPGEVLAPYDVDFNAYTSSSEESSDEEEYMSPTRTTPAPRIKLVKGSKVSKQKVPKPPRPSRQLPNDGLPIPSTSSALAKLKPPPDDAVLGGPDLPWLQLTPYELAKLRKRMKKNAVWNPSDTMIARELKSVGRGVEAYKEAQQKAKDEGKPFDAPLPTLVTDGSGVQHPPVGAISTEALGAEEVKLSNRGMKLNEAKKLKREQMAKQAADEAEESARRMKALAGSILWNHEGSPSVGAGVIEAPNPQPAQTPAPTPAPVQSTSKAQAKKRKRDSVTETAVPEVKTESQENGDSTPAQPVKPPIKRTKTETPVPPPQLTPRPTSVPPAVATPVPPPQIAQSATVQITSATPVPVPVPPTTQTTPQVALQPQPPQPPPAAAAASTPAPAPAPTSAPTPSPAPAPTPASAPAPAPAPAPALVPTQTMSQAGSQATQLTTVLPERPTASPSTSTSPAPPPSTTVPNTTTTTTTTTTTVPTKPPAVTPILPPKTSTTPILPPANHLTKRETRKDAQKNVQPLATNTKQPSTPRQNTPVTTPGPDQPSMNLRRPSSRGQGSSVEPPPTTLAAERPRRTSTARNTPAPEIRQPSKRIKRPAPGVISTSAGGAGSTSAIGKRTAAPRKKQRVKKTTQAEQEPEIEVDDEGNIIDPHEPRYCVCNGVSFGTMIQCDNVDVSKREDSSDSESDSDNVPLSNARSSRSGCKSAATASKSSANKNRKRKRYGSILTKHPTQNCKQEWFHLECVGLTEIPARTTKWYCPDCRVLLNIGGRGEVTSRGVKL
ncbi:hypothetical protein PFICI_07369 [Pestalotiopsis fici W106-1]|uniref:Inhibitor of growth protein N-terminal histone-binding domain-containing protein n=1 Tax=Pestalotiopsis fici (strain W106-1 / CGMCC3.15140) TaxID=1229662 RepID=W3X190_PESFW|nr:uncharacterized protein PFICI_07369 [Pestalotiopsis fici W106-1]ETS79840.1 hypothetical protein PFICI_07369 [Pestalotiopsis fici W106-1]